VHSAKGLSWLEQQDSYSLPHGPHAPAEHVPPADSQVCPEATHAPLSQQPPPAHALPSQQAWPGPPHAAHVFWELHPRFGPVHVPDGSGPMAIPEEQHGCPLPPQVPHDPSLQVPSDPPQLTPDPVHWPPTQHPPPLHALPPQQGWPVPPHAPIVPFEQTVAPAAAWPEARQLPPLQQPPPEQGVLPAPVQHAVPGAPHTAHAPALQVPPVWQVAPEAWQIPTAGSQQPPPLHDVPQQTWPG
jgi:hypothetical protein